MYSGHSMSEHSMRSVSGERIIVGLFLECYRKSCMWCVLPTDVPFNSVEASKERSHSYSPILVSYAVTEY